jgi:CubicO group peptidase (beta-lactamase class C family)
MRRAGLDEDVNAVTLRGLLSMTAGIGVPGFLGYALGAPLPTLTQILDGTPPTNSAPVTVTAVPGSAYHYSGGGYEIAEALMVDAAQAPFAETIDNLVLKPAGMRSSTFAQPLPAEIEPQAATGHFADGRELASSSPSTPRRASGRRRRTSPISCSCLAGHGAGKANSFFCPTRRGRC